MKYKNIFTSWWFWSLVAAFFIWRTLGVPFGIEFLAEYLGILLGSFIGILFIVSIFWGLNKGYAMIKKYIEEQKGI